METLFSAAEIREAVGRVANRLNADYADAPLVIIGVATGAIVFLSDLMRLLKMPIDLELVRARSYRGAAVTPGRLDVDLWGLAPERIAGRTVLLVDDIFDTGRTLAALSEKLREHGAAEVKTVVFLEKPERRETALKPDYVGLRVPNRFVVGYGLDFDGRMRNLPYIAALDEDQSAGS